MHLFSVVRRILSTHEVQRLKSSGSETNLRVQVLTSFLESGQHVSRCLNFWNCGEILHVFCAFEKAVAIFTYLFAIATKPDTLELTCTHGACGTRSRLPVSHGLAWSIQ